MLKPEQCRGARGVLGWSQLKLAQEAGVSLKTIQNFEHGKHSANKATISMLKVTLERAGISFDGDVITGGKQASLLAQNTQSNAVGNWYNTQNEQQSEETNATLREQIRQELRAEVMDEVRASTRGEVEDELRPLIKVKVMDEVRDQLRNEVSDEVARNLETKIREQVTASLPTKESLREQVRNEVHEELKDAVHKEEADRIWKEVEAEIRSTIPVSEPVENVRAKLLEEIRPQLKEELQSEFDRELNGRVAQIEKDLRFSLRSEIDRELRQDIRDEVWNQAYAQGKHEMEAQVAQIRSESRSQSFNVPVAREQIEQALADLSQAIVARAGDKLGPLVSRNAVEQLVDMATRDVQDRLHHQLRQAA